MDLGSSLKKTETEALPLGALDQTLQRAQGLLLSQQFHEGYWWYTLEANESIAAEYIFLTEFLGTTDPIVHEGLCRRILSKQRSDGSWSLFHGGPGELGTTIECYWALKLCGHKIQSDPMRRARDFILQAGGPTKARVFTKIHMALFGLAPWRAAPAMPLSLILAPPWAPVNIYEFSSWARACIVPLLVILNERPIHPLKIDLEELYPEAPEDRDWSLGVQKKEDGLSGRVSLDNVFLITDKLLKILNKGFKLPKVIRDPALKACEKYIRTHIEKTEDIFPALAYGAMALKVLSYPVTDPTLAKALKALEAFQQVSKPDLEALPRPVGPRTEHELVHQQCCISPVWDTPWAAVSLIESGLSPRHPAILKAVDWLVTKQITEVRGDWAVKNKEARPGGWSFEFQNEYYPDVDDTVEVLTLMHLRGLETPELEQSFLRGLEWLLSMQSKNGGWAAFDVDNTLELVNRIPFSDHGACLDPPTPDITARIVEFLALIGFNLKDVRVERALKFLQKTQLPHGAWEGRWGVNYLYGTWCVLQGLGAAQKNLEDPSVRQAIAWLREVQNPDGGWGESCEGYLQGCFVPLSSSVPSQTAWAVMGLIAAGQAASPEVARGVEFLLSRQNAQGGWDEEEYTGTGFPGHFYIRYHGYRHYFPLLALGKYRKAISG